ncbi:Ubiquitin-conjugating enzyme E2 27 [Babesia sp. Xinjiang]|uniref:Ubiquitin-conjugating enzyme E2 27 n=1 Tax=Babesia sp. Xinjiang TaxID=462227 RepID=UPI000A262808|nr:Ubiquitin-conjugating enzyme E2 27 [Babesia sp. Xinjiang]ORM39575.1 Ubiquitin-conjugating enzyme E2 27 [Babesia sp. Xinjiang]
MLLLERELKDIQKDHDGSVDAHMIDRDIYTWRGYIKGPIQTPYEGGYFILAIKIPEDYPYNPPKIHFETKIWHPNISSETGAICLDILKNEWSPALTIRTALLSIQALLSAPEPDDPQDAEVASMYRRNYGEFVKTAKLWTSTFAQNQSETREGKVSTLLEMGIDLETATKALQDNGWDTTVAINRIKAAQQRYVAPNFSDNQLYLRGYGRHWGEKITYSVGLAYGSGLLLGGSFGLVKGVAKGGATRKLFINSILNTCGTYGPRLGNGAACVTLLYCVINTVTKLSRGERAGEDAYIAPAAGLAAGALYKCKGTWPALAKYSLGSAAAFSAIDYALRNSLI